MDFSKSEEGPVVVVKPTGTIAKRAAGEFERAMLGVLDDGHRLVVVDFSSVELITSEGIRVLMLLSQRLDRSGGGLVLCTLGPDVLGVFDVTGLKDRFQIVDSPTEAIAQLSSKAGAARAAAGSRLTRLVVRLLGRSPSPEQPSAASDKPSELTRQVAALLRDDS